jgi:endonuclease/exonuclease/phosphatase family metal-dependent hydrolase
MPNTKKEVIKMKKKLSVVFIMILLALGLYIYYSRYKPIPQDQDDNFVATSQKATDPQSYFGPLKLAEWNIRIFSSDKRDDNELRLICKNLINYDIIALLEVRDEDILRRTENMLSTMGRDYDFQVSDEIGRGVKERYAFLYDQAKVAVVKQGQVFPDKGDYFIREPYFATFRSGNFDFTLIAVHIIWGDKVSERRAEIQKLAEVYENIKNSDPNEKDIILVGDFNREPNDDKAFSGLRNIPSMTNLFNLPLKSIIFDTNLYDNIWFQADNLKEFTGYKGIDKFDEIQFANNDKKASLAISDHRPVWAVFDTRKDDD